MKMFVVTSFSAQGYQDYGRRFLATFDRFFPADIPIIAYLEAPLAGAPDRVQVRWLDEVPAFENFRRQWEGNPLASGRQEMPCWKSKDRTDGYSFKTDALKFCRKVFALEDAAARAMHDPEPVLMFWIDADVVATAPPPAQLFTRMMERADVAYLGRTGTHSECGFLGFRVPQAFGLISRWADFYFLGDWQREVEWHDSYLFDRARQEFPKLRYNDISPGGRGHVWHSTVLGSCLDHLKGERKALGYSPERKVAR